MPKKAKAAAAAPATLNDAQIAAVAGAFKDGAITAAKSALGQGAVNPVDFTIRITGNVTKGFDSPGATTEVPQTVDVYQPAFVHALLRKLGFGPIRVAGALMDLGDPRSANFDTDLDAVLTAHKSRIEAGLPKVPATVSGKRGSVSANVSVQLLD